LAVENVKILVRFWTTLQLQLIASIAGMQQDVVSRKVGLQLHRRSTHMLNFGNFGPQILFQPIKINFYQLLIYKALIIGDAPQKVKISQVVKNKKAT